MWATHGGVQTALYMFARARNGNLLQSAKREWFIFFFCRSLEFLNDQHQGEDRVRLGRSYNSDDDYESNEVYKF